MKINLPGVITFLIVLSIINGYMKDDPRQMPNFNGPVQFEISPADQGGLRRIKKIGDWKVIYMPLGNYEIAGRVINLVPYFYGFDAVISPYDLGIVWGPYKEDAHFSKLKATYGRRVLNYKWSKGHEDIRIGSNVANIHVVPKNNDILKKIRKIRRGDEIYLKGYLIKVQGINAETKQKYLRQSNFLGADATRGLSQTMYVEDIIYHHSKILKLKKP